MPYAIGSTAAFWTLQRIESFIQELSAVPGNDSDTLSRRELSRPYNTCLGADELLYLRPCKPAN
jgi:hypothetical protein